MNKVAHCTRPHSPEGASQCDSDCSAQVSAVTQLDMDLLCITGPENELLTRDVQVAMRHDVLNNPFWANAVWLQCEHDDTGVVTEMAPQHLPVYNPNDSHMVLHLKAVVWAKGLPIAVYDCTTPGTIDTALRTHFQPLAKALDSFWTLKRSVDHLHVDGPIKEASAAKNVDARPKQHVEGAIFGETELPIAARVPTAPLALGCSPISRGATDPLSSLQGPLSRSAQRCPFCGFQHQAQG